MDRKSLDLFLYCSGVVLFPGATLPLRVIQFNLVAAVERALSQVDVPYTIGVVGELLTTTAYVICQCLEFSDCFSYIKHVCSSSRLEFTGILKTIG